MTDRFDAVVVGGGVVGAAAALALHQRGRRVRLVEARQPTAWQADAHDPRVYALSPSSVAFLKQLGVWDAVASRRAQPFTKMRVWTDGGDIGFDAAEQGVDALGVIVEDSALREALWAALPETPQCPASVVSMDCHVDARVLMLDDDTTLEGRVVIAADGQQSAIRRLAGIRTDTRRYDARAIVCHVDAEQAHADTAWQRFWPSGPLGLLPLSDGRLSVVWSADDSSAQRLLDLQDDAFCAELTQALDGRLGAVTHTGPRLSFPLLRQHTQQYAQDRLALVGDAAHSIHPLAGQGLNLGLSDAAVLAASVGARDSGGAAGLARYARDRRAENARMIAITDGFDRLFSNRNLALRAVRGVGLNAVDLLGGVKRVMGAVAI